MRTFDITIKNEYQYPNDSYNHPEIIRTYNIREGETININVKQNCDGMDKYATNFGYSNYMLNIFLLSLLGVKLKFNVDESTEEKYKKIAIKDGIDPESSYLYVLKDIQEEYELYDFKFDKEINLTVHYYNAKESVKLQELRKDKELYHLCEDFITLRIDNKYYEFKLNGEGYWNGNGWLLANHIHLNYNILSDICETILKHFCVVNIKHDYGVNKDSSEEEIILKLIDDCKVYEDKPTDEVVKKVKNYYQLRNNSPTLSPFDCFINLI